MIILVKYPSWTIRVKLEKLNNCPFITVQSSGACNYPSLPYWFNLLAGIAPLFQPRHAGATQTILLFLCSLSRGNSNKMQWIKITSRFESYPVLRFLKVFQGLRRLKWLKTTVDEQADWCFCPRSSPSYVGLPSSDQVTLKPSSGFFIMIAPLGLFYDVHWPPPSVAPSGSERLSWRHATSETLLTSMDLGLALRFRLARRGTVRAVFWPGSVVLHCGFKKGTKLTVTWNYRAL